MCVLQPLEELKLTWTSLSPPLGMARLKTVELLLVLLKTKKRYVEELVIKLDLINICLVWMLVRNPGNDTKCRARFLAGVAVSIPVDCATHPKQCVSRITTCVAQLDTVKLFCDDFSWIQWCRGVYQSYGASSNVQRPLSGSRSSPS